MENPLDILFPKTCSICGKKGTYICNRCKKLFKRSLPECYLCRKLSPSYKTHEKCKKSREGCYLNNVFVAWEYNSLSSTLLKKYKYKYVYDISNILSEFFVESISKSIFLNSLENTLLTNIPLSNNRLRERGFNQTLDISKAVSKRFNLPFTESLLRRRYTTEHQALKDKGERKTVSKKDFIVKSDFDLSNYKSITIIDDVITTGSTLESSSEALREVFGKDLVINSICMLRGRAYYL